MSSYIIKSGETISDIAFNSTGNVANWKSILDANGYNEWIPTLTVGQSLFIPDSLVKIQPNNLKNLKIYPACNSSIPDVYSLIDNYSQNSDWILLTGFWNDLGHWYDTALWTD